MKELIEFAREFIKENPSLRGEVIDLIQLCRDEIDEGGSPAHEISLCVESIKQLKD
ncbi:MAG: hypothetical protein RLZ10_708 [Bacteroidota bacterium]|jgi:hypothetical protein